MPQELNMQASLQQAAVQQATIQQAAAQQISQAAQNGFNQGLSAGMNVDMRCQNQVSAAQNCADAVREEVADRCETLVDCLKDAGANDAVISAMQQFQQASEDVVNGTVDRINDFLASFSSVSGDMAQAFADSRAAFANLASELAQSLALQVEEQTLSLGADIDRAISEDPDDATFTNTIDDAARDVAQLRDAFDADLQRAADDGAKLRAEQARNDEAVRAARDQQDDQRR